VDRAVAPVCVVAVLVSAAIVLSLDYGRDQAIYALVAREVLHGKMPYRDAFDFKPPGIFVVYAIARALFGPAQVGIRILEVLSMLTTAGCLVRLARLHFGSTRPGLIAAALASQVHAQLDFWHTAQPETFGGTLTLLGLLASTSAFRAREAPKRSLPLWAAGGALFGLAGLMKPPLAGAGAAVAGLAALAIVFPALVGETASGSWRARGARAASTLAATAVGGALPFVITLAWFFAKGALHDLHEVLFVFTPYYTKLSWENARLLGMAYYGFTEWFVAYSGAMLTGVLALALTRPTRREAPYVAVVASIVVVHIAGVVMQGKFFPYHWGATFPLTATLAGLGLHKALAWTMRRGPAPTAALVALFSAAAVAKAPVPNMGPTFLERAGRRAAIYLRGPMNEAERDALASVADVDAAENRAVAKWVREHTRPDDRLFVWGFECVIYDLADRPLASRYIYDVPQRATWSAKPMQESLMRELTATPPAAIVVEHNDVFPMVTGNNEDSAHSLFDGLSELIDERYAHAIRIGDFDVYLEKSRVPAQAAESLD
jgi:4-amino-4-deoxy-L-arabinose transferase-like glycosyltransferase